MSTFALEHFNKEVYDMLHDGIQNVFVYMDYIFERYTGLH